MEVEVGDVDREVRKESGDGVGRELLGGRNGCRKWGCREVWNECR